MSESRTKNSIRNFRYGAITQILNTIISFISRTIFIKILGEEYLGINGLFTNILTVLSFAELGIGSAIIYSMYKPIANEDKKKIKGLMQLYKKCYSTIGIIVLLFGLCLTPFLNFMIKEPPKISESLSLIYILYLVNTALSYFFTYKKSIISGYQKEYIINRYKIIFIIVKNLLQISFLIITYNFILYLLIQILCTFIENLMVSIKANKLYPFINSNLEEKINNEEKKEIFKNVKSLVLYKFGSVILNGTDSIIISKMIGVVTVGIYSNYLLIVQAVSAVIGNALQGLTASIGNLNATSNEKDKERIFYEIFFISTWIFGFCSIALITLLNPFIEIWIGKEYLLEKTAVFAIVLHFFINGVQFAGYTYRTTAGLFIKGKMAPIVAAIINIILSIILGHFWGITGILLSTSIARLTTTTWLDPFLVHKYEFKTSWIKFVKEYLYYILIIIFNCIICNYFIKDIGEGIGNFILKAIIVTIISNMIFLIIFFRKEEFKNTFYRIKNIFKVKGDKKDDIS